MKKSLFFALAVAGMFSSCSSEDAIVGGDQENSELVPIELGVSSKVINGTRGTGTVGTVENEGTEASASQWAGQKVNVYMLDENLDVANFVSENPASLISGPIFENATLITPTDGTSTAYREDKLVKYYPSLGNYSFWGYRLDDPNAAEPQKEGDEWNVDFTIDGSQDVMVAKTELSDEDKTTIAEWPTENQGRLYSAYSARHGVQPTLKFEHLLTRLAFKVKDAGMGEGDTESALKVVAIRVKSKTTGKLTIAYTGEKENVIAFNEDSKEFVSIKKRAEGTAVNEDLVNLTTEGDNTTYIPLTNSLETIGEALLVSPEDEYEMEIVLAQTVKTTEDGDTQEELFPVPGIIRPATEGDTFKTGYSYVVNVSVYGLQQIEISTTLVPWTDGGNVDITPEDQF